jgi:hypothetical protein
MEALSKLFSITVQRGFLSGFSVGSGSNGVINISHLLFANDILVFCGANPDHLLYLRMLVLSFEAVSGLKINLDKSVLVHVGHVDNMDDLAGILGCGVSSLPLKYFGLPLGAPFKAKSNWDEVVCKIEKRLISWKRLYLSKGGGVNLIKCTLSNLPMYFLSLFYIPFSVASRIEKLHRDFLWGGIGEEFKFHLVNWSKVYYPITNGGLDIRNLRIFNKVLLGKWLWRYAHEKEAWWKSVVDAKYDSTWDGWCSLDPPGSHRMGLWKNIRKGWSLLCSHTRLILGNGSRIRFWDDVWCGEVPLKEALPVLYDIARDKDAHVRFF